MMPHLDIMTPPAGAPTMHRFFWPTDLFPGAQWLRHALLVTPLPGNVGFSLAALMFATMSTGCAGALEAQGVRSGLSSAQLMAGCPAAGMGAK